MASRLHPDVYTNEQSYPAQSFQSIDTAVGGFEGITIKGPVGKAIPIRSFSDFMRIFGGFTNQSYLAYALQAYYQMAGNNLAYVVRTVHYNSAAQVPSGSAVIAMVVGGTANSATTINVSTPAASAAVAAGTVITVGQQIAVVKAASTTAPYSLTQQLLTLQNALPLGSPAVGVSVSDFDTNTFRQSAPAQLFVLDSGGASGTAQASVLLQSVYDGTFYNGLQCSIASDSIVSTKLSAAASVGAQQISVSNALNLKVGHILQIGTGNTPTTQEYHAITAIAGTTITLDTPLTNAYALNVAVIEQSFDVTIFSFNNQVEFWKQVSMGKNAPNYIVNILNNATGGSNYITAIDLNASTGLGNKPADLAQANGNLVGGLDGIVNPVTLSNMMTDQDYLGSAANATGLHAFDAITDTVLYINIPGITTAAVQSGGVSYVLGRNPMDAMFIMDSPQGYSPTQMQNLISTSGSILSSYAALYYPWVQVPDAGGTGISPLKLIPPGGYAIGAYAATDKKRGTQKAPAGRDAILLGAVGLEYRITNTDQDLLHPIGVNCIRFMQNYGICVYGARTLSSAGGDTQFGQVNVRRIFLRIEKELTINTRWSVFEPDDDQLWGKLWNDTNAYLLAKFKKRYFAGKTPQASFFVICDSTNNNASTQAQYTTVVTIGLAPSKPSEFIVFNIGQTQQGTTITQLSSV